MATTQLYKRIFMPRLSRQVAHLSGLVLALVLGDMAETSFRQSMLISKGSLDIFVSTPLAGSITGLALIMLVWPLLGLFKKLSRG